jgi:phosphomannomutase
VGALEAAQAWLAQDPDDATRSELQALIDSGDSTALEERFSGRLQFGTAGLRGEIGAGPTRMNRVLVSQAAAGLAAYLLGRAGASSGAEAGSASDNDRPSVVIGYDGRTNSDLFARDTAEIMTGAGVRAILLPRRLPTPVLAFAVRLLDASAGVMVTASHNPAADNGYKVYLGGPDGGSQIVAPADAAIAAEITRVAAGDIRDLPRSDDFTIADEGLVDAYVAATAAVASADAAPLRFVYTAMHGVGFETASRVFAAAGLGEAIVVEEQRDPDAAFPTVAFPNPEEPGALDLALAKAETVEADLVVANDPDADRLAIAIPDVAGWRRLSGNEVGALLGWAAARTLHERGETGTLAASLVSSPALVDVAETYGLAFQQTLTGFKWISRVPSLAFGYEEALGYLVNPADVRDKDGISAAVAFLSLVSGLAARGETILDHMRDFDEQFGAHRSSQISIRVRDLARIGELMARLRAAPPEHIGRVRVAHVDDFLDGVDGFDPSDILRFRLEHGARVIVRPSGTEPKLKVYIDASSATGSVDERRGEAQRIVDDLDRGMRALLD